MDPKWFQNGPKMPPLGVSWGPLGMQFLHLLCSSPKSAPKAPQKHPKSTPKAPPKHPKSIAKAPQKHPESIPKAHHSKHTTYLPENVQN